MTCLQLLSYWTSSLYIITLTRYQHTRQRLVTRMERVMATHCDLETKRYKMRTSRQLGADGHEPLGHQVFLFSQPRTLASMSKKSVTSSNDSPSLSRPGGNDRADREAVRVRRDRENDFVDGSELRQGSSAMAANPATPRSVRSIPSEAVCKRC